MRNTEAMSRFFSPNFLFQSDFSSSFHGSVNLRMVSCFCFFCSNDTKHFSHYQGIPWLSLELWYNTKRTHLVRQVPTTNYKHKHDLMWLLLMEQDKILKWFLKAHNGGVWDMLETWRILPYRLYIYNIHICMYVYIHALSRKKNSTIYFYINTMWWENNKNIPRQLTME